MDVDLPAPLLIGNKFQMFELSFPFSRTYITALAAKVREAANLDQIYDRGDGTTVTLTSLRETLDTAAWAELRKDDSRVTKLITSRVFTEDKDSDKISVTSLLVFGFLHCAGSVTLKSEVLYELFQDGGPSVHSELSANDKDIKPIIYKLIRLCTIELVQLMKEVDGINTDDLVDDIKLEAIGGDCEDMLEANYLEPLYGTISRMSHVNWMSNSWKTKAIAKVWYEPQNLRLLAFTRVGVASEEVTAFELFCETNKVDIGN